MVKGRHVPVPRAAGRGALRFPRSCEAPLGARDFLAIAARYDTIFIDHVPVLAEARRNEAKRLILLIDTLYDAARGWWSAPRPPPVGLYAGRRGNEAFEFERTASRLIEMQGKDWLDAWAARHEAAPPAAAAS